LNVNTLKIKLIDDQMHTNFINLQCQCI